MNGKQEKEKSEKLFEENQGLVFYMAKKRFRNVRIDDDMIQEGLIALWKASVTYSEEKNTKFSTYALHCIDNAFKQRFRTENRNAADTIYLSDLILERLIDEHGGYEMESEEFFKCFLDSLEETERIVANGLIEGETILQISKDNGKSDTWGHRRKKIIAEKYRKWMN